RARGSLPCWREHKPRDFAVECAHDHTQPQPDGRPQKTANSTVLRNVRTASLHRLTYRDTRGGTDQVAPVKNSAVAVRVRVYMHSDRHGGVSAYSICVVTKRRGLVTTSGSDQGPTCGCPPPARSSWRVVSTRAVSDGGHKIDPVFVVVKCAFLIVQ